ncbi:hypothetical protein RRG08_048171 [Elysia crispata]|uniref:Uncharacterized protein n=1 Tax=Elysia crispata TaxID=231223 RepID=A0AAE0ZJM0_9GAST|nr:hypothetical protein RRG08_048171 [Elysia crispata]
MEVLWLVFFLVKFLIASVYSSACLSLWNCTDLFEYGPNGTYSYTVLQQRPDTQDEWDTIYNNICNSRLARERCIMEAVDSWTCTERTQWRRTIKAKWLGEKMCELNNRAQYRRLWSEEPNCIANTSLLAIGTAYALNCEKTYNYKQVKNMKRADRCQAVNNTRNCQNQFYMDHCGAVTRYSFDLSWFATIRIFHPVCFTLLRPSMHQLPPETVES